MEWYVILAIVIMSISILRGILIDVRRRIRGKDVHQLTRILIDQKKNIMITTI